MPGSPAVEELDVLAVRQHEQRRVRLRWGRDDQVTYWITLDDPDGGTEQTGTDLFEALIAVRRQLAHGGWRLAVQGARTDTYPSGMLRDMNGARKVYVLELGLPSSRDHLVDIFADADPAAIGTVEEQRDHFTAWRKSQQAG